MEDNSAQLTHFCAHVAALVIFPWIECNVPVLLYLRVSKVSFSEFFVILMLVFLQYFKRRCAEVWYGV